MTLDYINGISFTKSVSGYKPTEVDVFIDEVSSSFKEKEKEIENLKQNIDTVSALVEEYRTQENSIHTALLNAQKLADNVISEANKSAEQIISDAQNRANKITEEVDSLSSQRRSELDRNIAELDKSSKSEAKRIVDDASSRAEAIIIASNECVSEEQAYFDKLKQEVADFKAELLRLYQNHIEFINRVPEFIENEPINAAKNAIEKIDNIHEIALKEISPEIIPEIIPEVIASEPEEEILEPQVIEPIELVYEEQSEAEEVQPVSAELEETAEKIPAEAVEEYSEPAEVHEPVPVAVKKSGFKIKVEDDEESDEDIALTSSLKFGGEYDLADDTPENDEAAGYGFFKRHKK